MVKKTTIIIGGDISPTKRDKAAFFKGDANSLFGDILEDIQEANYSIANLEFPVIDKESPINKSGAVFGAAPGVLQAIKNAGIDFLNLANNHIYDHGAEGLKSTLKHLRQNKFDFAGAGVNRFEASRPLINEVKGIKIGILTYCEAEFSVNREMSYGANHLDLIDFSYKMQSLKKEADFIILLYHGGKENYIYPSPIQRKNCQFFIDFGVNLVVCQHSHTIGLDEAYGNGHIFYGQGNFLFDPFPLKKDWLYIGHLIRIVFEDVSEYRVETIPYLHKSFTDKTSIGIRKLCQNDIKAINWLNHVKKENAKLSQEYIEGKWKELAIKERRKYYSLIHGSSRISRKLNEKFNYLDVLYGSHKKVILKNVFHCETHLELLQSILKEDLEDE